MKKSNRAFTLIELLVYLGLVALIATALIFWSIDLTAAGDKGYAVTEVEANRRLINAFLADKLKTADLVIEPPPGETSAELRLIDTLSGDSLEFAVTDGRLRLVENGGLALPLSSAAVEVKELFFTNLTPPLAERSSVRWTLELAYRNPASAAFRAEVRAQTATTQRP